MTTYAIDHGLVNGKWVQRGMVWRWVQNAPVSTVRTYEPSELIACPTCRARMDERCRTSDGASHKRRLVKRVCSCGGPVRPREPMCGFCRAEMTVRSAA